MTITERVEKLETQIHKVATVIDHNNRQMRDSIGGLTEIVAAILKEGGEEYEKSIERRVIAARQEREREEEERATEVFNNAVENGQLVPTEVVGPSSVVVGKEFDTNGNLVREAVRIQFQDFVEQAQQALLAQKVGFVFTDPSGSQFEVTAIYNMAPKSE